MFNQKPIAGDQALQKEIDALLASMLDDDKGSKEYLTKVDQLVKLYSLKEDTSKKRVSPDTLAIVLGNIAGIFVIVAAEKQSVITSKALSFILKAR